VFRVPSRSLGARQGCPVSAPWKRSPCKRRNVVFWSLLHTNTFMHTHKTTKTHTTTVHLYSHAFQPCIEPLFFFPSVAHTPFHNKKGCMFLQLRFHRRCCFFQNTRGRAINFTFCLKREAKTKQTKQQAKKQTQSINQTTNAHSFNMPRMCPQATF